jgi:hypothetical protein
MIMAAATANAVFIFITFLFSVPAMIMPMTRGWLKLHGLMVVFSAMFTLVLGLDIWFGTLKTRTNLMTVFSSQPDSTLSLVQQNVRFPDSAWYTGLIEIAWVLRLHEHHRFRYGYHLYKRICCSRKI